ncbi:unnamed protein product [Symbiodinium sp. CCMP2592]|nr:unnamed protein product [Symbiodinium sp. CCMP2592]
MSASNPPAEQKGEALEEPAAPAASADNDSKDRSRCEPEWLRDIAFNSLMQEAPEALAAHISVSDRGTCNLLVLYRVSLQEPQPSVAPASNPTAEQKGEALESLEESQLEDEQDEPVGILQQCGVRRPHLLLRDKIQERMKAGADVWASLLPLLDEPTREDLQGACMDEAAAVISFLEIHNVQEWEALPNERRQLYVPTNVAGVLQSSGSGWRRAVSCWLLAGIEDDFDAATHVESLEPAAKVLWYRLRTDLKPFPSGSWTEWGGSGLLPVAVKQESEWCGSLGQLIGEFGGNFAAGGVKNEVASPRIKIKKEPASSASPPRATTLPQQKVKGELGSPVRASSSGSSATTTLPQQKVKEELGSPVLASSAAKASRSTAPSGSVGKPVKEEPSPASSSASHSTAVIEKHLLQGTSPEKLQPEQPLNYGQVLRCLIFIANLNLGPDWPSKVGVLLASAEQSKHCLKLQMAAPHLAAVLQSRGHWALLMVRKQDPSAAVLYDGKNDSHCRDMAVALMEHLVEATYLEKQVPVEAAKVPRQVDTWSCGHRSALAFERCLADVSLGEPLPRVLASGDLNDFRVRGLEALYNADQGKSSPSRHMGDLSPPKKAEDVDLKLGGRIVYAGTKRKVKEGPSASSASKAAAKPKPAAKAKTPKKLQLEGRELMHGHLSHGEFQARHRLEQGKTTLAEKGGHWQSFCEAVAAPERMLGCTVCISLRQELREALASAAEESSRQSLAALQQVVQLPEHQDHGSIVVGDRVRTPGRRPRKEAAESRFDLHRFVQKERGDVYRLTDFSYLKGKITYHCLACQKSVNFFVSTNDSKLAVHEKGHKHIEGLARLQKQKQDAEEKAIPLQDVSGGRLPQQPQASGANEAPAQVVESGGRLPQQPQASGANKAPAQVVEADGCPCDGLGLEERSPLHSVRAGITTFFQAGCPRTVFQRGETDPLKEVVLAQTADGIKLRATHCQGRIDGHNARMKVACAICMKHCGTKAVMKHILKKAYLLDLASWAWQLFYGSEQGAAEAANRIKEADYRRQGHAGLDFEELCGLSCKLQIARSVWNKFENIPKIRRSTEMQDFIDRYVVKPQLFHSGDNEARAHSSLVAAFANQVGAGNVQSTDLVLAAKVAAGELRQDSLISGLVTTFLMQYRRSLGCKRKNSSAHSDPEALSEVLGMLGVRSEAEALVQRFHVNPQSLPRLVLHSATLPNAFCSLRSQADVDMAAQTAISLLRLQGGRGHLLVDETVWAPCYEQVSGLRAEKPGEMKEIGIVGGEFSDDPAEDFSYIKASDRQISDLPPERLARLTLHLALHRADNSAHVFDLAVLPRPQGQADSQTLLRFVASALDSCARVNNGVPVIGASHDGASVNSMLNRCQSGLESEDVLRNFPFFRDCVVEPMAPQLPCFPYKQLRYMQQHLLVGCTDGWHCQKRYGLQHSSGIRYITYGCMTVCLTPEVRANIGHQIHCLFDTMSDKHAAARMSHVFMPLSFDALGAHVHGVYGALLASFTTASHAFSKHEHAVNAFSLYYGLLLHMMTNRARFGDDAGLYSISTITLRNLCSLCAHGIQSTRIPGLEPRLVQELPIEHHFGRLKSHFRGQGSIRDAVHALRLEAGKQARRLEHVADPSELDARTSAESREALGADEILECAKEGLAAALQFQAFLMPDDRPEDLYEHLRKWYPAIGHKLLTQRELPEEEMEDWMDLSAQELTLDEMKELTAGKEGPENPQKQASGAEDKQLLQSIEDRALLRAKLRGEIEATATDNLDDSVCEDGGFVQPDPDDTEGEGQKQPKTLRDVMRIAVSQKLSCFDMGEPSATGELAIVRRVSAMLPGMRSFMSYTRGAEGLLSWAWLDTQSQAKDNAWNVGQHQLAKARLAQGLCKMRMARSTAWQQSQAKAIRDVTKKVAESGIAKAGQGVIEPASFSPLFQEDGTYQILAIKGKACYASAPRVVLGCVQAVFRGSVVRRANGTATYKCGGPCSIALPSSSTRVLHCTEFSEKDGGWFETSCASQPLVIEAEDVLGELAMSRQAISASRLRILLTPASLAAVQYMRTSAFKIPKVSESKAS